jgi:Fe-S cluster assembly iron-binding protein IscA
MNITDSAKNKIAELIQDDFFRVQSTGDFINGFHIELSIERSRKNLDIDLCTLPKIISDFGTANYLSGMIIDFNTNTDEIVITKEG